MSILSILSWIRRNVSWSFVAILILALVVSSVCYKREVSRLSTMFSEERSRNDVLVKERAELRVEVSRLKYLLSVKEFEDSVVKDLVVSVEETEKDICEIKEEVSMLEDDWFNDKIPDSLLDLISRSFNGG